MNFANEFLERRLRELERDVASNKQGAVRALSRFRGELIEFYQRRLDATDAVERTLHIPDAANKHVVTEISKALDARNKEGRQCLQDE
jgi:hypothetical protein